MRLFFALIIWLTMLSLPASAQTRGPLVLAAASMQEAMTDAAEHWAKLGHPKPVLSFAGSSALARQVSAGAPADLFISADQEWMDDLAKRGLLVKDTRAIMAGNRLVLIARAGTASVKGMRGPSLAKLLGQDAVAMADPDAVPAGRYGRSALQRLGAWQAIAPRVVRTQNVRAALALVEQGAVPYGVVYATDARVAPQLQVAGVFPESSHAKIVYPIARLKASRHPDAEGFRRFLLSSTGKAIMRRYGFITP